MALSIRTNPSYSSEYVRNNVFVVAYVALASVPGHLSMKHDTSSCISFRLSTGWVALVLFLFMVASIHSQLNAGHSQCSVVLLFETGRLTDRWSRADRTVLEVRSHRSSLLTLSLLIPEEVQGPNPTLLSIDFYQFTGSFVKQTLPFTSIALYSGTQWKPF